MAKQTYTAGQVLTAAEMTTLQANDYNQTVSAKTASYTLVAADAGTTITMNNAGATTITVNTALFTAGDTLKILNIGAGVLTVTAGTATVSSSNSLALNQYDNGILYFTSTGVSIFTAEGSNVTLAGTQTLSNKTLSLPVISGTTPSGNAVLYVSSAGDLLVNSQASNVITTNGGSGGVSYFSKSVAPFGVGTTAKTASFTLAAAENCIICTGTAIITVTLPAGVVTTGSANIGRTLLITNRAAFTVVSATANVVQKTGGAATTAILPATSGAWALLVLDFSLGWTIVASGT